MFENECARQGNRELATFLSVSLRTCAKLVKEMKEIGVVFEMYKGRPPQIVNMWFPSAVVRYMAVRQMATNEQRQNAKHMKELYDENL